ncbi:collagen alpha-1(VIII) chain-like isoform X2 [Mercenaria mercenaria]|nr:collagen alpha-1(VIII) chain-like isoform X2 [Mercenaria mercenaria]
MIKTEIFVEKIKSDNENMQLQMSSRFDALQDDWENVKNEINDAREENRKVIDKIKDKVDDQENVAVAFAAHNLEKISPKNGETLVFSRTSFDRGSSYNNKTGVYVTPVAGIYMFNLHLCLSDGHYVYYEIDTENEPIMMGLFSDDDGRYVSCQMATTTAILGAKERVWIKVVSSVSGLRFFKDSRVWNSFSGVLLTTIN